jgi:hypothetical protein
LCLHRGDKGHKRQDARRDKLPNKTLHVTSSNSMVVLTRSWGGSLDRRETSHFV